MNSLFTMDAITGTALFYLSFTRFMNGQPLLGSIILVATFINYFVMYVKEVERIRLNSTGVEFDELPDEQEQEEEEEEREDPPLPLSPVEDGEMADDETEPIKEEPPSQAEAETDFIECSQCGTLIEPDLAGMCNACMKAVYCDETCQRNHWKNGHKEECSVSRKRKRTDIIC